MSEFKVFFDNASINAKQIISQLDYQLTKTPAEADLIWLRNNYKSHFNKLEQYQLLNHIPKQFSMTDKGFLTGYLNTFERLNSHLQYSPRHFYPESARLYIQREREQFLEKNKDDNQPWVLKRTNLSKGCGIHILENLNDLREYYINGKPSELIEKIGEEHYVVQRYVKDVLLLNNRKSEVRIYWLIACLDPLIILIYNQGTVRLCCKEFKLGDFNNKSIHVTNTFQQTKQDDFDSNFKLKWSFDELQNYILKTKITTKPNYIKECLINKMSQALLCVVNSTIDNLSKTSDQGLFFGLYGADFILDKNLDPWLTEIQISPGLIFNDPIKKAIIPKMLNEAFSILQEIQCKKINNKLLNDLTSLKNFKIIN